MKSPALRDALVCVWLLLLAIAFWGPYLGLGLPAAALTAAYAAFLVLFISSAALRAVSGNASSVRSDDAAATAASASTEGNASGAR